MEKQVQQKSTEEISINGVIPVRLAGGEKLHLHGELRVRNAVRMYGDIPAVHQPVKHGTPEKSSEAA